MHVRTMLTGLILCLCVKSSLAAVTVGTCRADKQRYSTISAAVAAASPGEIVYVCPGIYPEQVEIDKPLTIQGIQGTPVIAIHLQD